MKKLRVTIEQYGRWELLAEYIDRIEAAMLADFSLALENAKSMLETIGKEICSHAAVEIKSEDFHQVIKKAFCALGYDNQDMVNQISGSLANIANKIGYLRNQISPTSHGRTINELQQRNNKVDQLTKEFLIDSTSLIAVLLIRAFEEKHDTLFSVEITDKEKVQLNYNELNEFNELWDESFGEFVMGDYSFPASEILFNVDYDAYNYEYSIFLQET